MEKAPMSDFDAEREPFPHLVDELFSFELHGRGHTGGWLEIRYDGVLVEMVKLPRAKHAVLSLLARRARATDGLNNLKAFMTMDKLIEELRNRTPFKYAGRQNVTRYVYDLRKLLTDAKAASYDRNDRPGPLKWGHRVIESQPHLGYRISVPPENIDFDDLD
jgi:hypothetical protein